MTTFGLVHGAYHGSWCWEQLTPVLEARGHRVLTVDLPCEDPEAGASEYADAAVEAFRDAADDLVLVGHSLGGLTIPVIAARRPVRRLVFVCAMLPRPGRALDDVLKDESDMTLPGPAGGAYPDADGLTRWHPDAAAAYFFSDCTPELAAWAAQRLRGQSWKIAEEVTPLREWPPVPSSAVIGARDPVINPDWSRRLTPRVLGASPVELDCGHSPFLSAPVLLADALTADV
jgi:pimeloyl-ACP methyl ester carboxylesterase